MLAIRLKFPAGLLVFDRPVIVLKLRIAFFPRFVLAAVCIKTRDRKPGAISTGLTSLRIESRCKGEFFGKDSAIGLHVVFTHTLPIHPQTKTFVSDELNR